jgi:rubrerythrin
MEFGMTHEDAKQLERMIEVIARAIPKERDAAKLYRDTARSTKQEMARMLFEKLASQEEEHELKLRSAMEILRRELAMAKAHPEAAHPSHEASHEFNVNIRRTLRLTKEMIDLAEQGLRDANDPSCQLMYGKMKEMSEVLRMLAEGEAEKHIEKDKWD